MIAAFKITPEFVIAGFFLRSFPPLATVYKGHSDSILDFAVWGQDIVSISKNKIGLSSLTGAADEVSAKTAAYIPCFQLSNLIVHLCT